MVKRARSPNGRQGHSVIQGYNMGQIHHQWNPQEFEGLMAKIKRVVKLVITKTKEVLKKAA